MLGGRIESQSEVITAIVSGYNNNNNNNNNTQHTTTHNNNNNSPCCGWAPHQALSECGRVLLAKLRPKTCQLAAAVGTIHRDCSCKPC